MSVQDEAGPTDTTEPTQTPEAADASVVEPAPVVEPVTPATSANRGLKLAIVALAALSLGLAVLAASLSARNRDTEGRSAAVRRSAAAMGTAMLTYDYRRLPEAKARVVALSTGTFEKQYREAFDGGFDQLYKATKQVSKVRDVSVYLNDVTAEEATAIVQVDFLVSGVAGQNRPRTAFLEFSLVRTGERWLVDSVSTINAGNEAETAETTTPAE